MFQFNAYSTLFEKRRFFFQFDIPANFISLIIFFIVINIDNWSYKNVISVQYFTDDIF